MAGMENAALDLVETFQPDELTQYMWAVASLRYRPTGAFFAAAERRIADCPAKYSAESVTLTLWAYATLGLAPGGRVLDRFADELEGMTSSDFRPQDLSLGFWSAAVLVTQPRSGGSRDDDEGFHTEENTTTREGGGHAEVLRALARQLPSLTADVITPEGSRRCSWPRWRWTYIRTTPTGAAAAGVPASL